MTCQDSFHEVAFNISFWTRNISSARILFWRGVFATIQKLYRRLVRSVKCAKKARIATSLLLRVVHTNEQMKIQIFLHAYIREKVELQEMKW